MDAFAKNKLIAGGGTDFVNGCGGAE